MSCSITKTRMMVHVLMGELHFLSTQHVMTIPGMVMRATPSATTAVSSMNTQSGYWASAGNLGDQFLQHLKENTKLIYSREDKNHAKKLASVYSLCCCVAICKVTSTLPLCLSALSGKELAIPRTIAIS